MYPTKPAATTAHTKTQVSDHANDVMVGAAIYADLHVRLRADKVSLKS